MADLIDRKAALDAIMGQPPEPHYPSWYAAQIEKLPAVQPDYVADIGKKVSIPCAHENDLIFRQAAIDALKDWYDGMIISSFRGIEKVIKALPSAQPEERKKGAWILGFDNQYLEKYYFCSKCGSRKYMEDKPLDNFCANCGADMRGEQDG